MGTPKNWLGIEPHVTDRFVHWKNRNGLETMQRLRKAYDLLSQVDKEGLEYLLEAAYDHGRSEEFEANCPDL